MDSEFIVPDWPAPDAIVAGTTTRSVAANRLPQGIRFLNQVHGATAIAMQDLRRADTAPDADAVFGDSPGDICAVRTADCVPLLLCARDGSEIAAVHGGWRGVLAGVIENTVAAMRADGKELLAWLGPAISREAFEVGDEVREAFVAEDAADAAQFEANARGRWQADLYGLSRKRLANAGIRDVYGGEFCTFGDPERFWSYRRNPECGRMVSFVSIRLL